MRVAKLTTDDRCEQDLNIDPEDLVASSLNFRSQVEQATRYTQDNMYY